MSDEQQVSTKKNASFFFNNHADYQSKILSLKTYQEIYREVSNAVDGAVNLIDIGNGGVFDYDTSKVKHITAIDLMFTPGFKAVTPANSEVRLGSALNLPLPDSSADVAMMNMLLHHLTGKDVKTTQTNLRRSMSEAARVLSPGGKIVVMESCVPSWFFAFEKVVYKASIKIIERITEHPPTLQFPVHFVASLLEESFVDVRIRRVPKGAWVLQYGKYWPSILTPAQPYLFTGRKR